MTKAEHTRDYSVAKYTETLEKYLGAPIDTVIYNNKTPAPELLKRYAREGDALVSWSDLPESAELIGANLLSKRDTNFQKIGTPGMEASLVRHDSNKLAAIIAKLLKLEKPQTAALRKKERVLA